MDKETFKNAEGKLYGYFRDLNEISILEIECKDLKDQEESIKLDIQHCNVSVVPDMHMSPGFDERVQTSPTGESVAEKGIIREIEKLEDELEYVERKIRGNRKRIR
ncbi:hypothetical protein CLCOS_39770 [Clostridium coskatii]|uniref:Uncharacterized protein n=1 Tax=Clostridium coskatii TaxID=1705578 RepID=A0ABX2WPN2_9CLOT|nr:hypothetical protein CLCOS_39770 [Clostridium coskatii]